MSKVLFESRDRDEAHAHQSKVIGDGSAPLATCTEHVERGDTVVVWDGSPTPEDLNNLARTPPSPVARTPAPAPAAAPAPRRRSSK